MCALSRMIGRPRAPTMGLTDRSRTPESKPQECADDAGKRGHIERGPPPSIWWNDRDRLVHERLTTVERAVTAVMLMCWVVEVACRLCGLTGRPTAPAPCVRAR
jgi:hypothetical protein